MEKILDTIEKVIAFGLLSVPCALVCQAVYVLLS